MSIGISVLFLFGLCSVFVRFFAYYDIKPKYISRAEKYISGGKKYIL